MSDEHNAPHLARELGFLGLVATGVCSMLGAAIVIIPFMIQRTAPGIGSWVLPAFLFAAVPAIFAGLALAVLASAMPRAGGSYLYASRSLTPYLGFVASFSQWFSLCVAMGVVSFLFAPFARDVLVAAGWSGATVLDAAPVRLSLALLLLWSATIINLRGVRSYERTVVPLMFLSFALCVLVIVAGFSHDHADFVATMARRGQTIAADAPATAFSPGTFFPAAVVLFSVYIGFDSIAQAGGEAKDAERTLPLAIGVAIASVGTIYILFTAAVYHAVPWTHVAAEAARHDVTAPGLLAPLLPRAWTVLIVSGAAVALAKDLPAMLLGVSRLMFAWAEDGIFPRAVAAVHPQHRTPHVAIVASALMASLAIIGSHLAQDFFLGVDILVLSMLVSFLLMCASVLALPHRNPAIAKRIRVARSRAAQLLIGGVGCIVIAGFLAAHVWHDVTSAGIAWYLRSTTLWIATMAVATAIYVREMRALRRRGVDVDAAFSTLPSE